MIELARSCGRHRAALLDFVDRGEIARETAAALAHLDRCPRCTAELESTMLTITALRRLGVEVATVEPSADAWPRLRARITGWSRVRWGLLSPTSGLALSVALVAVLVAPLRMGVSGGEVPSAAPGLHAAAFRAELRAERNYLALIRQVSLPASEPTVRPSGSLPRYYPDGIHPSRKEVSPAGPSGRPSEAI